MIFSRGNLLPVKITEEDKDIPITHNIHFMKDGSTVGANGISVLMVSPVNEEWRNSVPIHETNMLTDETISSESIKAVLKNIPARDTEFGGLLEYVDLCGGKFTISDGKRKKKIEAKMYNKKYVKFLDILRKAYNKKTEIRSAVNLKRFISFLQNVDTICPDSSKHSIVYLEFTESQDIIIRCENIKTKQRVFGVIKAYEGEEGKWLDLGKWERKILDIKGKAEKVLKQVIKKIHVSSGIKKRAIDSLRIKINNMKKGG